MGYCKLAENIEGKGGRKKWLVIWIGIQDQIN